MRKPDVGAVGRRWARPAAAAMSLLLVGCVTLPKTGRPDSREPLELRADSGKYDERVNIGGESFKTGKKKSYYVFLGYYQGNQKLDEQDFFTIAGDIESANKVAAWRQRNQIIGIASMVGTAVALGVAGVGGYLYATNPTPPAPADGSDPVTPEAQVTGLTLMGVGATAAILLSTLWGLASAGLSPDRYLFEGRDPAYEDAHRYNAELSGQRSEAPAAPSADEERVFTTVVPLVSDAPVRMTLAPLSLRLEQR